MAPIDTDHHPDFIIVCNHDHRGGPLDPVARYDWVDKRGAWEEQGASVGITYLEGDTPGWHVPSRGPSRVHHEIPRSENRCCGKRVRIPDEHLQRLLSYISVAPKYRIFVAAESATELTVTLDALRMARDRAAKDGLLR